MEIGMSQETLAALLAALLPLALTALVTWWERRGQEARRNTAIDTANKRIQFLHSYLTTQQLILPPEPYESLKQTLGAEVERIYEDLAIELNEIERITRRTKEKNLIQRIFLLYRLQTTGARLFRALFYTLLITSTVLSILFTIGTITNQDINIISTILGISVILLPFIGLGLLFRWLALQRERNAQDESA
jgi:hypothetical protein